ncbi:MAG: hypothetical protein RR092_07865 [Oscillospiraceae bacterium]
MKSTLFLSGIGIGMLAGAALEVLAMPRQKAMKTPMGKAMQRAGVAVDRAAAQVLSAMEQ